jgi:hypothetical protein
MTGDELEQRRRAGRLAVNRLAAIKSAVSEWECGDKNAVETVNRIADIVADPIVRVGRPHEPEIQT